jgi:anion-transporting  ArsA/GET3 family ATPase
MFVRESSAPKQEAWSKSVLCERKSTTPRASALSHIAAGAAVSPQLLCPAVPALLDKRLIFVTGKGGVGKSTVATALGLLAAREGLRTVIAELSSQERVQRLFEHDGEHFEEVELAPGLFTISIDPEHAMDEYLRVKLGALGHALGSSRMFHAFAMATPGMRELLSIGKVWELAQLHRRTRGAAPYDLVIVDAPATGHGLGLLRTPKTFADIARVGPIAHQGRTIAATIADHDFTGVVAVATPEEMPVNETLSLSDSLVSEDLPLDVVVLNALYPVRFAEDEVGELEATLARSRSQLSRSALSAALSEHARAETQREQLDRLRAGVNGRLVELPFVFADHLGQAELERLADALGAGLNGASR